jgi:vacuolar-type H+-ATPase subunit F/Vma7
VAPGFELAGLRTVEASRPQETAERLAELSEDPKVGIVLIQDTLFESLPEGVRPRIGRRPLPMVVPFPGPAWVVRPEGAEAYVVELLRQVVGYRVRLR